MRRNLVPVLLLSSLAAAQQSKPAQNPIPAATAAKPTPAPAPRPTPAAPPAQPTLQPLTELERTQLENLQLKSQLLQTEAQGQAQQLAAQQGALIAAIEKAHPGYRWQQGQLPGQPSGLVPVTPEPKK